MVMICTVRVWPSRWMRALRCSSTAGFQGTSRLTSTAPLCRLSPTPPASVDRNTCTASSSRNRSISSPRLAVGTPPCRRTQPRPRRAIRASAICVIRSHWEKTTALSPDCRQTSLRMSASSSSLGAPRVSLSTRPAALQAMRACCRAASSRFCSLGVSGRRRAICARQPAAFMAASCSSRCLGVRTTSSRWTIRSGSCSRTKRRSRRSITGASRLRSTLRLR